MSKVFIYDEFSPEDVAMMQALYSRSAASVKEHAQKVQKSGSGNFMRKFYVGYGHASIADCGSTTLFVEGVSMLAAKAIEDWPLFSGQETSSRYIDFSQQKIIDPIKTLASKKILRRWLDFYINSQPAVAACLREKYPKRPDEDETVYDRAIKARTFDILRGFLPAGITTQLSWHTNLRQAYDKLAIMAHHPLPEVSQLAKTMLGKLKEKYNSSFSQINNKEQLIFWKQLNKKYNYFLEKKYVGDFSAKHCIDKKALKTYIGLIKKRPPKTNLPHFLSELGNVTFDFLLDFGSFRDIQRHRCGVCRMPLLTAQYGFNKWYLGQLPKDLRQAAERLIKEQIAEIKKLKAAPEIAQYYLAMGFNVTARVSYGLPAVVYVVELRSGRMVHPTLRLVAHKMYNYLRRTFPELLIYADLSLDDWDVRRGLQDIKEKKK